MGEWAEQETRSAWNNQGFSCWIWAHVSSLTFQLLAVMVVLLTTLVLWAAAFSKFLLDQLCETLLSLLFKFWCQNPIPISLHLSLLRIIVYILVTVKHVLMEISCLIYAPTHLPASCLGPPWTKFCYMEHSSWDLTKFICNFTQWMTIFGSFS